MGLYMILSRDVTALVRSVVKGVTRDRKSRVRFLG
jgi:hypothetical protein